MDRQAIMGILIRARIVERGAFARNFAMQLPVANDLPEFSLSFPIRYSSPCFKIQRTVRRSSFYSLSEYFLAVLITRVARPSVKIKKIAHEFALI